MDNERLRITLDRTDQTYFAGQTIQGIIWLNLTKRTKIRDIKVQITGKGKCKWMEILRKNSQLNESTRSLFYSSKEIYCHSENNLPVFQPRGLELNAGEHKFDFTVPLKWNLPSTFKGSHGSIKYKLRILIQRPWTFDERHTIPINVIKYIPLLPCLRQNPITLEKQITKTISLFGTRPITMLALLPEDFAVCGKPLRICVTVTNNSTTNVEKLRFTVLQHILYYSQLPLRIEKMETVSIASKETGAVQKKSERSFAHELIIPTTAQPTDCENSAIINISYELRVEAVLRGFFKNLVLNLPFKLYSGNPEVNVTNANEQLSHIAVRNSVLHDASNNFDTTAALPVYPSLDSSVGSPSRSSQYSESSSLYSTASDSSATTLSPAVGGGEFSYVSSESSQYNSSGASAANVRGTSLPCRPMMVYSYPPQDTPPYPLSESISSTASTQSEAATITLTSQASSSSLPTSSALFLNRREPPGADELPPSYEELFGTAPRL